MRCLFLKSGLLALGLAAAAAAGLAEPVKVAVFKTGFGARAVLDALKKDARTQPVLLKAITVEDLMQADVLYVGSTSLEQPEQIKNIKIFVACGGGVILNHAACGRYRPETLFPNVALKVLDRRDDSILRVQDPAHPLAAGLPAEFEHAFSDHLYLEPGPDGIAALIDREGAAVAVAGAAGAGRVVFNGALPGYWYDPTDYKQAEKEPAGAELQWVLNAIDWAAGAPRLTSLPAGELAARRTKAEADIKLDELARNLPGTNWFGNEMLRGSYLTLPPVTEIGGRFFITYDGMSWRRNHRVDGADGREFFLNRLKHDILQLKWLGITDIIYWTDMYGEKVSHKTTVPDSQEQYIGIDPLAELIRLATPEGMNVWAAWHSCSRSREFAEKYGARNANGEFYLYGGSHYMEDLLNPACLDRCRMMLDEYADKFKPLGNFEGLLTLDELWFNYADFHGDDLPAIEKFCLENFGEKLPADFAARLELRTRWKDPADPWRRRYILFKQKVMTDYFRGLVEHAHKRGLRMGVTTVYIPGKWSFGMDNIALSRLGADFILGASRGYPNSLQWTHIYAPWGHYTTMNMLGGPGGLMFTFNHLWRLIMFGNDPHYAQQFARHIYTIRMFADAEPLARVAFLENHQALEMLAPDPVPPWNRLGALFNAVQRNQDVRRIYSQATELFENYRVLVATPFAARGLPGEALDGLRQFVENGGAVVSIDADWSSARADMANELDRTVEMAGVAYGALAPPVAAAFTWKGQTIAIARETPRRLTTVADGAAVLAAFADGAPAVTEKIIGQGRVIALHFDAGAELSQNGNPALAAALNACLREHARPPVVADSGATPVAVRSALKKGNWIAVALFPDRTPAVANVKVDVAAMGIQKKAFRLLMLGKQMEISRPGDLWGASGFWTPEDLKNGFQVSLPEDHRRYLPLPEEFDLSDFTGKHGESDAEYLDKVTRDWWDSEKRGKRKRDYAHEVVVIAPADEHAMPRP